MGTLLRIGWTNLKRDRVAQALTFLLPIIFFSIFASVFGGQRGDTTPRIRVAVVDEDGSDFSRRVVAGMSKEDGLSVQTGTSTDRDAQALDRQSAQKIVRSGEVPIAVVLPRGMGAAFAERGFAADGPKVQVLADPSDPIASNMVQGLLQKVVMTAAPDLMMAGGMRQFEKRAGALTPQQREAVAQWLPQLQANAARGDGTGSGLGMGVGIDVVDVMRTDDRRGSLISFYAAGIGVMFLLFSSVGGAGGALLEEAESGTLERLLSSNIGMSGVLVGKWLFLAIMGMAQLTVMFLWGRLMFGLPLFQHIPGFLVMTAITAAAAAALGMVLATLARTRAQLSGFSTILILTMSALGGSMFPRFLMSESMQKVGLLTFNAWALDGYLKVFWRNAPLWQLWPQVLVLSTLTVMFLGAARVLARRWGG
ncbi:MAG: ABC transporter permease [Vicinamibacterales bacterium]